jgi:anti-anti-sigma regulatory factor
MGRVAPETPPTIFSLPPVVTVRDVALLRDQTLALLLTGQPLVIEGSAVEKADVSVIQLLVAAKRMAERDGIRLEMKLPATGVVAEMIRASGLTHEFDRFGEAE